MNNSNTVDHFDQSSEAPNKGVVLADRWSRLFAVLIDALIQLPFALGIMYLTGGFDYLTTGGEPPSMAYNLLMALVGIVLYVIINGRFLVRDGQTIGKKVMSIKIAMMDGQQADVASLAKRYGFMFLVPQIPIAGAIFGLIDTLFVFSKSKRCIHDRLAGTQVVAIDK